MLAGEFAILIHIGGSAFLIHQSADFFESLAELIEFR
jgi:hypothetical protein